MKRIFAVLLVICISTSLASLSHTVNAATTYTEGYYTYTVADGKATITHVNPSISGNVTVPSTLGGYPVTVLDAGAFYGCSDYDGNGLKSVIIPNSVTYIGNRNFSSCEYLESITIGKNVVYIGDGLFSGGSGVAATDSLKKIIVDKNNPVYHSSGNCLIETESKTLIIGCKASVIPSDGSVTHIGDNAFYSRVPETLTIPNAIVSIGDGAFAADAYSNGSLKNLEISNSVEYIGAQAFYNQTKLKSITIPKNVKTIGDRAFSGCASIKSLHFPASVTSIGEYLLGGMWDHYFCTNLVNITVDKNNPIYHSSGNCLIETESKTLIAGCKASVIPSDGSVTHIGDGAFLGCFELTSITIPKGVVSIGNYAFSMCKSLKTITISSSVAYIGSGAFSEDGYGYGDRFVPLENAYFESTQDWSAESHSYWGSEITDLASEDLAKSQKAAEFLTNTYVDYEWKRIVMGDVDGKIGLTADDAIYVLYNVFFGEDEYPLEKPCNFDGIGSVTANDAIYLLYHVFFGEETYPLN